MSLEKVLRLAGSPLAVQPEQAGIPEYELLLSARAAVSELCLYFAASGDDEETDSGSGGKNSGDDDSDSGNDHSGHGTYKALIKKKVDPKKAAAMCAKSDAKVQASALADSAYTILSGLSETDLMVALSAVTKDVKGTAAVAHPPFHGVHAHAHVHAGDNMHGGASDRYAAG